MIKKISRKQADHAWKAAAVVPQVKDQGSGTIQLSHSCGSSNATHRCVRKRIEFQITDVVRQYIDPFKSAMDPLHLVSIRGRKRRRRLRRALRYNTGAIKQNQFVV